MKISLLLIAGMLITGTPTEIGGLTGTIGGVATGLTTALALTSILARSVVVNNVLF